MTPAHDAARLMVRVSMPQQPEPAAAPGEATAGRPHSAPAAQGSAPHRPAGKAAARRRPLRQRALAGPPPELLVVPQRLGVPALKKAAAAALRQLYRMFQDFQVRAMQGTLYCIEGKGYLHFPLSCHEGLEDG